MAMSSEEVSFARVEKAEDHIVEIMELFCDVQTEICEEMITINDDMPDALECNFFDQASNTQRSHAAAGDQ